MYDLTFIIPLYGENCWKTSIRMNTTIACLKTKKKVRAMYIFDKSVSYECVMNIDKLFNELDSDIKFTLIPVDNPRSGYKRNIAIERASKDSKYIWLLDQDDWLMVEDLDSIINAADGNVTEEEPIIKINFVHPQTVAYRTNIADVITMPWQYIALSSVLKNYKFEEDIEMGSDVPVFPEIIQKYYAGKRMSQIVAPIYFYNHINVNSESYRFFVERKNTIADKAAIDKLRAENNKSD